MLKLYVKIEAVLKDVLESLLQEHGSPAVTFGEHLTPTEMIFAEDLRKILQDLDDATMLLRKTNSPSIQDVEIVTASLIANLSNVSSSNGNSAPIAKILLGDILQRRRKLCNEFPIIELLLLVSTLFPSEYKKGKYTKYLGEGMVYTLDKKQAVKSMHKMAKFISRNQLQRLLRLTHLHWMVKQSLKGY